MSKLLLLKKNLALKETLSIDNSTLLGIWEIEENENYFDSVYPFNFSSIKNQKLRVQKKAVRWLAKSLYPSFPLEKIKTHSGNKKPFIADTHLDFSFSHTQYYCACILSTQYQVSIDIEQITQKSIRVIDKFLNEEEKKLLPLPLVEKELYATLFWSCKEVLFKFENKKGVVWKEDMKIDNIVFQSKNKGFVNTYFGTTFYKINFKVEAEKYLYCWLISPFDKNRPPGKASSKST